MRQLMIFLVLCAYARADLPVQRRIGALEQVAAFHGAMPTGVTVSRAGRVFVNFPRWGDDVPFTVGEVKGGRAVAYPPQARWHATSGPAAKRLVSVQSVVVDARDRLWLLDTGDAGPEPMAPGGPKLVEVDLRTDRVRRVIALPADVALKTTYLNDVRFDLRRGRAFITDSSSVGPNGIIVVDLASGRSWRALHDHPSTKADPSFVPVVEGEVLLRRAKGKAPKPLGVGADGIAISHDGARLFYCALSARRLYSVSVDALARRLPASEVAATVVDHGEKGASDGLESDAQGRVYATDYEHGAIRRRGTDGAWETLVHDPRVLWPDTLSLGHDGWLYFTANQLHRQAGFQGGEDRRRKPYSVFRVRVGASPVALR
jgi:sugar lactone lactonase YvrE